MAKLCPAGGVGVVGGESWQQADARDYRALAREASRQAVEGYASWLVAACKPHWFATFTLDERKVAYRRGLIPASKISRNVAANRDALDGIDPDALLVRPRQFRALLGEYAGIVTSATGRRLYAFGGVELHKSGQAHGHLMMRLGDELLTSDFDYLRNAWYRVNGAIKLEHLTAGREAFVTQYSLKRAASYSLKSDPALASPWLSHEMRDALRDSASEVGGSDGRMPGRPISRGTVTAPLTRRVPVTTR